MNAGRSGGAGKERVMEMSRTWLNVCVKFLLAEIKERVTQPVLEQMMRGRAKRKRKIIRGKTVVYGKSSTLDQPVKSFCNSYSNLQKQLLFTYVRASCLPCYQEWVTPLMVAKKRQTLYKEPHWEPLGFSANPHATYASKKVFCEVHTFSEMP